MELGRDGDWGRDRRQGGRRRLGRERGREEGCGGSDRVWIATWRKLMMAGVECGCSWGWGIGDRVRSRCSSVRLCRGVRREGLYFGRCVLLW